MVTLTKPATKTKVKEPRTGRMNLRLSTSAKTLLTEAAQLCGLSLSEYVLRHSLEAAHQQLTKARISPLSEADTLATPPTEGPERAAKTYQQRVTGVREQSVADTVSPDDRVYLEPLGEKHDTTSFCS